MTPNRRRDLSIEDLAARWWRPVTAALLVAAAIVWRLVKNDLGAPPNLELSTFAAFAAAGLLRHRLAALAPLAVVAVSDVFLSNSWIFVFTWSAWLLIGLGALCTKHSTGARRVATAVIFGAGSSIGFYLWTNFGVWLQGRGTFYPAGLDGLLASYVAGLPFLRTMLLGNLVLLPLAAGVVALVERFERAHEVSTAPVRA
ncbi:hypothetical protein BJH93_07215 [Kocuria polaris]|nr:hypothetical protein [Kocuria polaris]